MLAIGGSRSRRQRGGTIVLGVTPKTFALFDWQGASLPCLGSITSQNKNQITGERKLESSLLHPSAVHLSCFK